MPGAHLLHRINKLIQLGKTRLYHKIYLRKQPVLFVNSIQKAGTHMLTNALSGTLPLKYNHRGIYNHTLTRLWAPGYEDQHTSASTVQEYFTKQAYPGEIVRGHVEFDPSLSDFLKTNHIYTILIIRHPLDVLLSLANWWERHNEIPVIPYLKFKEIPDNEEKVKFLLTGEYRNEKIWPDLIERFNSYAGWLTDPNCLVLDYDNVLAEPEKTAYAIQKHTGYEIDPEAFINYMNKKSNKTFTKPKQKIHTSISPALMERYRELGGPELENLFNFKSHTR